MPQDIAASLIEALTNLNETPESELELPQEFELQLARLYKKIRKRRRRKNGSRRKKHDRDAVAKISADRRRQLNQPLLESGSMPVAFQHAARTCYCCNEKYRTVHPNYHWLCVPCGDLSKSKRTQQADLSNYTALITGGRIKIGFETALWLLRCGAKVHVTTRFPIDAAIRYSELSDFDDFQHRLHIHSVDFRNLPRLLSFVDEINEIEDRLDILINHAAQSVKRSDSWHQRRVNFETSTTLSAPQQKLLCSPASNPNQAARQTPAIVGQLATLRDDNDRLDQREKNTWNSNLIDTNPLEIIEALLVNTNAPAILAKGFFDLLKSSPNPAKFVINVTGADGNFSLSKSGYHPHVNMSKAALNMMTRSCAEQFSKNAVYMSSVDTGWITHEGGYSYRQKRESENFLPPYDNRDGAARILDPIFQVVNGDAEALSGVLFRNFRPFRW